MSAPSSIIRSATRRRTVRRLRPMVRAICSSLAPAASWRRRNVRSSTRDLPTARRPPRPLPVELEEQGQRLDQRALPHQQPRLVGEAERLGDDRVGPADHEEPGRQVVDQAHLLPLVHPRLQHLRRLVQGPERVDRPRPAARRDGPADDPGDRRLAGHRPGVGPEEQQVALGRLDQRGEQGQRVAAGADLAVDAAEVLDLARPGPAAGRAEERDGAGQVVEPVAGARRQRRPRGRSPPRRPGQAAARGAGRRRG